MDILKPGDPCPCCGQPIKTKGPQLLLLLTLIRDDARYRAAVADAVYETLPKDGSPWGLAGGN